jgi:hypothetical protein
MPDSAASIDSVFMDGFEKRSDLQQRHPPSESIKSLGRPEETAEAAGWLRSDRGWHVSPACRRR